MESAIVREWVLFRLACQMLTRLPTARGIDYAPALDGAAIRYYPAVGIFLGLASGTVFAVTHAPFGPLPAAVLAIAATVLLTGAMHEDGLADTADGIGGGQSAARALEIMRDSRIGVYGVLALILVVAAKIFVLASLSPWMGLAVLVAVHGLSRWSVVLIIATAQYVRPAGTASPVAGKVSPPSHLVAGATAAACLILTGYAASPQAAAGLLVGLACGHAATRAAFQPKLKGYTGDCLGATQQVSELGAYLGLLACL